MLDPKTQKNVPVLIDEYGKLFAEISNIHDAKYLKNQLQDKMGLMTRQIKPIIKNGKQTNHLYFLEYENPNLNQYGLQSVVNSIELNKPKPSLLCTYDETMPRDFFGNFEALYLKHIYERIGDGCPEAIAVGTDFLTTTTRGFQHNRFRAKVAMRLKHIDIEEKKKIQIVDTILARLENGDIDEQFTEQLRLAKKWDKEKTLAMAYSLVDCKIEYIARYAKTVIRMGKMMN